MNTIKETNYITVPGWLRTRYNLKGNELLVAALIWGFSQDGETEFTGTLDYISEWIGCTKNATCMILGRLVQRGVLIKNEYVMIGNAKRCTYIFNDNYDYHSEGEKSHTKKLDGHTKKLDGSHTKKLDGNNIYIDNNNIYIEKENILKEKEDAEKNPEKEKSCAKKEKKSFAEFVEMTEAEMAKLVEEFGETGAFRLIEILNNYKGACGKKYKSDYLAIRNWVIKRYEEENGGKSEARKNLEFAAKNGVQSKNIIF